MRVFEPERKDPKTGKSIAYKLWYGELRDHLETIRQLPAFADKRQSEAFGRNVEKLVAAKINRDPPDKELGRWLEALPKAMRDKLFAGCGFQIWNDIDGATVTSTMPVALPTSKPCATRF